MPSWSLETSRQGTYEALAHRIQSILTSSKAQIEHQANIAREPDESLEHWERLLDEIRDSEGVTLSFRDDCSADVSWFVTCDL